ncbi:MAG: GNAT family N-acetyltransferase [Bdellovibrionaceae bacterium]|nr:GNAT family N-acetyltransferase [Pseudobdellovibrionaceae bacterium]
MVSSLSFGREELNIKSLGRRTDLIFADFSGVIEDRGHYTLIKTPDNPGFHWGNYIIFDRAPQPGDLKNWKTLFDREFTHYSEPHHYVFTWDTGDNDSGEYQEFLDAGFEFDSAVVLSTDQLSAPPHPNEKISVKKIKSDEDWEKVIHLQTLCADPKFLNLNFEEFKRSQIDQYKRMSQAGKGHWFGAFIGDQLVGDLGVFFDGKIGRYQNVGTHPDHRKQGICGTLVYQAGQIAFDEFSVDTLVMEADPDYHAARIYESVGFSKCEINYSLSWWKTSD